MHLLMQLYLWLLVAYLVATLGAMLFKAPRLAKAGLSLATWAEQAASHALLAVGLVGVYGYVYDVPILFALFWQTFLVVMGAFAALQHRMPKTLLLRQAHGSKAVVVATVAGAVLLAPMLGAIGLYGFAGAQFWA